MLAASDLAESDSCRLVGGVGRGWLSGRGVLNTHSRTWVMGSGVCDRSGLRVMRGAVAGSSWQCFSCGCKPWICVMGGWVRLSAFSWQAEGCETSMATCPSAPWQRTSRVPPAAVEARWQRMSTPIKGYLKIDPPVMI